MRNTSTSSNHEKRTLVQTMSGVGVFGGWGSAGDRIDKFSEGLGCVLQWGV